MIAAPADRGAESAVVLAEVGPDARYRALARAAAAVALVGAVALVVGLAASGIRIGPLGTILCALPLVVLAGTLSRGDLVAIRVTPFGLDLVGRDGVVRTVPGPHIGALGVSGRAVAGRLFTLPIGWLSSFEGRVVVLDHQGRVMSARRSGWVRVDDVVRLAAVAGVPWAGVLPRMVPGAPPHPPAAMGDPQPARAVDDPVTAAALARFGHRTRRAALVLAGLLGTGIAALTLLAQLPPDAPGRPALGWIGGLGLGSVLFTLPLVLVHLSESSRVRSILRAGPWYPVEAVVVAGLVTDATARTVGVVNPHTGDVEWWKVEAGGERGWLQGDDRAWFWYCPVPGRRRAALAPPDRSHVAVLGRTLLSKIALAEARSQVSGEAAAWQGHQARPAGPWR